MKVLMRCVKSDLYKLRHTSILWLHLLIPLVGAIVFLAYYSSSARGTSMSKISGYLEVLSITFPLLIGLISGMVMAQEEQAGDFQILLCGIESKFLTYLSKLMLLVLLGSFSIALSVGTFGLVFQTASPLLYLTAAGALLVGNLFLYVLHVFISLQFGMGASIGLGVAGSLVSALMLTGLGDGRWQWIPWAWAVRLVDYVVLKAMNPSLYALVSAELHNGFLVMIVVLCFSILASLYWFENWEGRKSHH